jgi:integrase/recombinase XerD
VAKPKQPGICQRKRPNGQITFYCKIGGETHGLGSDSEAAKAKFAALLAKHSTRQELSHQPAQPASKAKPALTVRAVLFKFLEWSQKHHAPTTYRFYRQPIAGNRKEGSKSKKPPLISFDEFLIAEGKAELLVSDFDHSHVEDWIDKHFANASDTYKHNLLRPIQTAFNWAMERKELRQQIGDNPLAGLKKPAQGTRERYITADEWAKIEATASGEFLDLLQVLKDSGARPQEIRAAEAKHLDREGRRLYFATPVKKLRGKPEPRIVHLTDRAFAICERLALKRPTGKLFRNENDAEWSKDTLCERCYRMRTALGFSFPIYSLRHTFATDRLIAGVDPLTVAKLMGHKNAEMVMKVYNRLNARQDHLRAALLKQSPAA